MKEGRDGKNARERERGERATERQNRSEGGRESAGRQRESKEVENEEVAIISLPVFDQWSMGNCGSTGSWSTAPEERSFKFLLASFPASAKSLVVFQITAAVKTVHGLIQSREDHANALWFHCPAAPYSLV